MRRLLAVGGVAGGLAAFRALDAPTAYHEAGHTIVALHLAQDGMPCAGSHGKLQLSGVSPTLLKFTTITPRTTEKGVVYLGETKLTTRWRHMRHHAEWIPSDGQRHSDSPRLLCAALHPPAGEGEEGGGGVAARCLANVTQQTPVDIARIAYLLGGRVAEDVLWERSVARWTAWSRAPPAGRALSSGCGSASERIAALVASSGCASGDLRKSQQIAEAQAAVTGVAPTALLEVAYDFSHSVLHQRWSHVKALTGALLARGTIDGAQLEALDQRLHVAQDAKDWMHIIADWPLLFGVIWAALECPKRRAPSPSCCEVPGDLASLGKSA
ncbi:hypothetical protein AB1Y20_013673 [Prymnesium parvum]|uniref:Peptidase M41 domain-containing protein n=1 Tax=Prymnesium parvum TaxID=97485 RepID=A0AB34II32_PRYPA